MPTNGTKVEKIRKEPTARTHDIQSDCVQNWIDVSPPALYTVGVLVFSHDHAQRTNWRTAMAPAIALPKAGSADVIPLWARREWEAVILRVKGSVAAVRLWHHVLNPAERRQLGKDLDAAYARYRGAVGMWRHLHGVTVPQAVVAVAVRIGFLHADLGQTLLRVLEADPVEAIDAVEAAVNSGGLVLVETPRQAYWERKSIEINWVKYPSRWDLLWALARASKGGGSMDKRALSELSEDPKIVTKRKHRLVNTDGFPLSLADIVVPAGRGTYRIDLPRDRIRVFERGVGDEVREWTP